MTRPDVEAKKAIRWCPLYRCTGVCCLRCGKLFAAMIEDVITDGCFECPSCHVQFKIPVYNVAYQIMKTRGYKVPKTPRLARFELVRQYLTGYDKWGREITHKPPWYWENHLPRYSEPNHRLVEVDFAHYDTKLLFALNCNNRR